MSTASVEAFCRASFRVDAAAAITFPVLSRGSYVADLR
jgi:hypothetical protein